jgi:hypothetical protein
MSMCQPFLFWNPLGQQAAVRSYAFTARIQEIDKERLEGVTDSARLLIPSKLGPSHQHSICCISSLDVSK